MAGLSSGIYTCGAVSMVVAFATLSCLHSTSPPRAMSSNILHARNQQAVRARGRDNPGTTLPGWTSTRFAASEDAHPASHPPVKTRTTQDLKPRIHSPPHRNITEPLSNQAHPAHSYAPSRLLAHNQRPQRHTRRRRSCSGIRIHFINGSAERLSSLESINTPYTPLFPMRAECRRLLSVGRMDGSIRNVARSFPMNDS